MTTVFIPRERVDGERRVAATPDSVKRLIAAGCDVGIETGAGAAAGYPDATFVDAGAQIIADETGGWPDAHLILSVQAPPTAMASLVGDGAVLVGLLAPHRHLDLVRTLAEHHATAVAMEFIPRISRAQRMDALSSQATLAGYRSVVLAAYRLGKTFPLSMTAAGTLRPATVVVLGAGVAGLQAIATARRLGAVVRANDIREAAKGEVESLGAEFIDIQAEADSEGEGGYAKEVGEDFLTRQRRILGDHIAQANAVVTTAFVPGRPAPTLVTAEMVERMAPGSVLIDLAAAEGGNCALTEAGAERDHEGVTIIGAPNLPSDVPGEASALYARNVAELAGVLLDDGQIRIDLDDEILSTALLVHGGKVTHAPTADLLGERAENPVGTERP